MLAQAVLSWRPALYSILIQAGVAFVAVLGVLQTATLHNSLEGLAWPVGSLHRRLGYLLGGLLMVIALGGSASLALTRVPVTLLSWVAGGVVGGGLALVVATVGAALRLAWDRHWRQPSPRLGRPITLGQAQATFVQPAGYGPYPAVCLVPDPTAPGDELNPLIQALVGSGMAVLTLDWRSLGRADRLTLQGLVSVSTSHLAQWTVTDGTRVGLVGIGLGGDLALRSTAMDPSIGVALAIEPALSRWRPSPGLAAMRCLSWFEARRRVRRWNRSKLIEPIDALAALPQIAPRPVGIISGSIAGPTSAGILEMLPVTGSCPFAPGSYPQVADRAARWLQERLT